MSRERNIPGLPGDPNTIGDRVVHVAAGTTNLSAELHEGRLLVASNAADAVTLVLPRSVGGGDIYKVLSTVDRTSGSLTFQVNGSGSNVMTAIVWSADSTAVATDTTAWFMTNASQIALNGSTTGGVGGDYFEFIDAKAGTWYVRGWSTCSGDKATPLTATTP